MDMAAAAAATAARISPAVGSMAAVPTVFSSGGAASGGFKCSSQAVVGGGTAAWDRAPRGALVAWSEARKPWAGEVVGTCAAGVITPAV